MDNNSDNSGSIRSSSGGDDQDHYDHTQPNTSLNQNPPSFQPNFFDHHQTSNLNFLQQYQLSTTTTTTTTNLDIANPPPPALFHATSSHGQLRSDHQNIGVMKKNPKKRARASRRAPTTVLTTDTSNFRQMVQEFTGIPAPPFSGGGLPYSRRLDLFRSSSSRPPIYTDHHHKVNIETQPNPPYHHHFSLLNNNNAINIMSSSGSNNFSQLIGSDQHNKTMFNDHQPNQILSFQSSFNPQLFEDQTKKMNFSSSASASSSAHEHEKGNTLDPWICPPE